MALNVRTGFGPVRVAANPVSDVVSTVDDGARKRDGFEMLRDIVTGHRRRWAERYLADYLKARWNAELRGVATEYNRRHAATGKTVTYKQFARFASGAANYWFNGDLAAVYSAVGEVAPIVPERHDLLRAIQLTSSKRCRAGFS